MEKVIGYSELGARMNIIDLSVYVFDDVNQNIQLSFLEKDSPTRDEFSKEFESLLVKYEKKHRSVKA